MNPTDFVSALAKVAPDKLKLLSTGYGDTEADDFRKTYECRPRRRVLELESQADPLLQLMNGWDISKVEIGNLRFLSEPVSSEGCLVMGQIESDKLVFRIATRDYALLDHESGKMLCRVAREGGSLLKALLLIAQFYSKTAVDEVSIDDESEALKIKADCMSELGGDEFETFCTTLLGV